MRTTFAVPSRARRKKVLERAKGFRGGRGNRIRDAYDAVMKSDAAAYIGRKQKKRQYRGLWLIRINAAVRPQGLTYSAFMHGLKMANIDMNRKMLSELAIQDAAAFTALVEVAKASLSK